MVDKLIFLPPPWNLATIIILRHGYKNSIFSKKAFRFLPEKLYGRPCILHMKQLIMADFSHSTIFIILYFQVFILDMDEPFIFGLVKFSLN